LDDDDDDDDDDDGKEGWHDENMRQQEVRIETRNFCDPIERRDVSYRTQELIPSMPHG